MLRARKALCKPAAAPWTHDAVPVSRVPAFLTRHDFEAERHPCRLTVSSSPSIRAAGLLECPPCGIGSTRRLQHDSAAKSAQREREKRNAQIAIRLWESRDPGRGRRHHEGHQLRARMPSMRNRLDAPSSARLCRKERSMLIYVRTATGCASSHGSSRVRENGKKETHKSLSDSGKAEIPGAARLCRKERSMLIYVRTATGYSRS
jgi:hypothetical protein